MNGRARNTPSIVAWIAAGLVSASCGEAATVPAGEEPVFRYALLENGDFAEAPATFLDEHGAPRLPWWRSSGDVELVDDASNGRALRLGPDGVVSQRLAYFAPLGTTLVISGRAGGSARFTLAGGDGQLRELEPQLGGIPDGGFELRIANLPGARLTPALELRCSVATGKDTRTAAITSLSASVDLPCPSEAALRAELITELDGIFTTWLERGRDDVGPRHTAFLARDFDAVTGAPGRTSTTGFTSFQQALLDATQVADVPRWRAALEAFLSDFLELGLHPTTGLPRAWNPETDVALDDAPVEIALPFGFLIDVAERGPQGLRERARQAALKIGESVLAHGLLPDGNCAASYVPSSGRPNLNVSHLRRLDVPLQLVRLTQLTGDARFAEAAREPLYALEFTNYWHGTWDEIDPGFDDSFGHYGARAARAARALESARDYRRFALEGWEHYEPLWRDALRFGGNLAADQVRCWRIGVDLAHVEPRLRERVGPLLRLAARAHFRNEQYENGAWGDVSAFDFRPSGGAETGDLTGAPVNLLAGLASIYVDELGLRTDEIRALYTSVLRSTRSQYRRPYGYLLTRGEQKGANSAYGSVRMLGGLVDMLTALAR